MKNIVSFNYKALFIKVLQNKFENIIVIIIIQHVEFIHGWLVQV